MVKKITGALLLVAGLLLVLASLAGGPGHVTWVNAVGALAGVALAAAGFLDLRHAQKAERRVG